MKWRQMHTQTCAVVQEINRSFQLIVLFQILYISVKTINSSYFLFIQMLNEGYTTNHLRQFHPFTESLFCLGLVAYAADKVKQQVNSFCNVFL